MNQKLSRQNLLQHEFIGLPVKVVESLNSAQLGAEGKVIDETMRMLIIDADGSRRMIPKAGTTFQFMLKNGSSADMKGELIQRRPEDRVKMNPRRVS